MAKAYYNLWLEVEPYLREDGDDVGSYADLTGMPFKLATCHGAQDLRRTVMSLGAWHEDIVEAYATAQQFERDPSPWRLGPNEYEDDPDMLMDELEPEEM